MRVAIIGGSGQLGIYLQVSLEQHGHETVALSRRTPTAVDVSQEGEVGRALTAVSPDAVIFAAALTSIEGCERDPELAWRVNACGPSEASTWCSSNGVPHIYISTDAVFNGASSWYSETDETDPLNAYALSKFLGERPVLSHGGTVVRTNFIGAGEGSLMSSLHKRLGNGEPVTGYSDVSFTPLYAGDAAEWIASLIDEPIEGLLHMGGPSRVTKLDVAGRLAGLMGKTPVVSGELPSDDVVRPRDTSLDSRRALSLLPFEASDWEDAVRRSLEDLDGRSSS